MTRPPARFILHWNDGQTSSSCCFLGAESLGGLPLAGTRGIDLAQPEPITDQMLESPSYSESCRAHPQQAHEHAGEKAR